MKGSHSSRWILAVAVVLLLAMSSAADAETNLNFVLGGKFLDSDDWPVGDSQGALSFLSTFGSEDWPVQVAIDVLGSATSEDSFNISRPGIEIRGEEITQSTVELDVGVRKIWRAGKARPFVGGGLAIIWGWQERAILRPPPFDIHGNEGIPLPPVIVSQEDEAPGAWVDGGVFWRLGRKFNLGLEARYSSAELGFAGRDVNAGGVSLGLLLGWGWGGGARIVP
jgi:hypothetical protein